MHSKWLGLAVVMAAWVVGFVDGLIVASDSKSRWVAAWKICGRALLLSGLSIYAMRIIDPSP